MTRDLQKLIFAGCRELNMREEDRQAMQKRVTGKASMRDMSEADLKLVVNELKSKGFVVRKSGKTKHKRAERRDVRLIHVLWKKLGDAGALRDPSRKGLNAFISRRFGNAWGFVPVDVDQLSDWQKIDQVIQALKNWGEREEIDFDWEAHQR